MQKIADLTAVILAGGLGTRLRPKVKNRPKVLAMVRGRPFLAYLLDQLAHAGVRHAVLSTGYLGEQVNAEFGESYGPLSLDYSQEPEPLGTAGALRLALPLFKSDPLLVMNGDSFCRCDLEIFYNWHLSKGANATLLLVEVETPHRYGQVTLDVDGQILNFDEKAEGTDPAWINAGIYLLQQRLVLEIPQKGAVSLEREIFPAWIGRKLFGYPGKGAFLDIGTPASYERSEDFFTGMSR